MGIGSPVNRQGDRKLKIAADSESELAPSNDPDS